MNSRVKEGELLKYRNPWKGWKKYYFKLERCYLHYFEGQYISEPRGTITRGEMAQVTFSKDHQSNFGFEIHLKNGYIWYLTATTHEERMEWMQALQPEVRIVDPLMEAMVNEELQPNAPAESQLPGQQTFASSNHPRLYPQLSLLTGSTMQEGFNVPGPGFNVPGRAPNSPPPAYDEINHL